MGSGFFWTAGIFYVSPHLHILTFHTTDSQSPFSPLSICCLKVGHHISRRNCSQKSQWDKFAVSRQAAALLCRKSELLAATRREFLISIFEQVREYEGGEAAWITECGRTGRWDTNVLLISWWWTRSGRAPYTPLALPSSPAPCENPGRLLTNVLLTWSRQPVIGKPWAAGRGMRSGRAMRHRRQRVKVSIAQSCL